MPEPLEGYIAFALEVDHGGVLWTARYDGERGLEGGVVASTRLAMDGARLLVAGLSRATLGDAAGTDIVIAEFESADGRPAAVHRLKDVLPSQVMGDTTERPHDLAATLAGESFYVLGEGDSHSTHGDWVVASFALAPR